MDLHLTAKRALVTGSTAGIGFAIAQSLAGEGATTIVNGRTEARVASAIDAIRKAVPMANVEGIAADLAKASGAKTVIAKYPDLDILVNNLGIFEIKPFELISDDDWMRFFETNVLSGVRLARHYLPRMLKANANGRIVFISSESAVQIPKEMIHYGMTKTAQVAVARGLAELTRATSVTVNSILVGPTRSEGVGTFMKQMAEKDGKDVGAVEKEFFNTARPSSLIRRFLETDEIGKVVAFVCSDLASAINGSALRAEGGLLQGAL